MSAQSMDKGVLKNIKRSNISLDAYKEINKYLRSEGRSTKAELIMLLPGETKESFVKGIEEIIETGVTKLTIYTLMLLYGTEFKNPEYRDKYGYIGKYRIVPLNFGEYENNKVFDYEEVAISNNDISFKEYLELRGLALLVETLLNDKPFDEFFMYAQSFGLSKIKVLRILSQNIDRAPQEVKAIYNDFISETKGELWDSEEELINHYKKKENYDLLKKGLVGGNLIYKYKSKSIALTLKGWLKFMADEILNHLIQDIDTQISIEELENQVSNISRFCLSKLDDMFDLKNPRPKQITEKFDYDIIKWIDNMYAPSLINYKLSSPISYTFVFSQDQLIQRNDFVKRYGNDINALSKIVTRISNVESCFRKIKIDSKTARDIYPATGAGDMFTRYTLAN